MTGTEPLSPALREQMVALLPRLRRFARSLTANDDAGDDLVQQTIERALSNIANFREGTRLDSWMYRIAQNLWIDRKRSERTRGVSVPVEEAFDVQSEDGRQVVEARLTLLETRRAIAELPEEQRSLVMMVLIDGMSYREASEIMDLPIGTVMSRLSRARSTLEARVYG